LPDAKTAKDYNPAKKLFFAILRLLRVKPFQSGTTKPQSLQT